MIGAKPALPLFMACTKITLPLLIQEWCGCRGVGLNTKFMKARLTCMTLVSKIICLYLKISYTLLGMKFVLRLCKKNIGE
jgi:hypothetical protein